MAWAVDSTDAVFPSVYDLMVQCLSNDPMCRPNARSAMQTLDALLAAVQNGSLRVGGKAPTSDSGEIPSPYGST